MKTLYKIFLAVVITTYLFACKKSADSEPVAAGTINVTNAVIGGFTITLTTNYNVLSSSNTVGNNASAFFPLVAGKNIPVNLGVPAIAATPTTPEIPAIPYYSQDLMVDNNSNYSLFLTGASPAAIESILISETYPRTYDDSVCGVRFINLSPGSNPISVNIPGSANGSEVASLAYKAYGDFKLYPAKAANKTILFEIRDAVTGTLLYPTSGSGYALNIPYFHNVTLAYRGSGSAVGIIVNADY